MQKRDLINAVKEIHELTNKGQALEAMNKYYDQDVVMIEDDGTATHGLEANLEREEQFFASIEQMNDMKILDTFVYGNTVVTTSYFDLIIGGRPYVNTQVSITEWNDQGKVIKEQFINKSF